MPSLSRWFVYLAHCRDGSLYCGIATDVGRRMAQHNAGKGAKYIVPSRRPALCVWKRRAVDQSEALRLEAWIKRRPVSVKQGLAGGRSALRRARDGTWKAVSKTPAPVKAQAALRKARKPPGRNAGGA